MVDAVIGRHIGQQEWIDAFQATHVVAVLIWKRTPLVMRVDTAVAAEIVLGDTRVELIELQAVNTLQDTDARQRHRSHDGALSPANGTIASARIDDAIRKIQFQHHSATVAAELVPGPDRHASKVLDHSSFTTCASEVAREAVSHPQSSREAASATAGSVAGAVASSCALHTRA